MTEIEKNTLISLVIKSEDLTNKEKEELIGKIKNSKGKESLIYLALLELLKEAVIEFMGNLPDIF